ncbi:MAG: Rpn family recombination-promoting nuclease/putative transposase [Bacteroides sp.]
MNEDNYIRFDWAVKRLLRNKANFGVLEGFLKTLLSDDIKIVEILESESNQENESDKFNRVDIKAKDSRGEIIIVEIQNTRELYYLERILYGVAKAITEHINLGDSYALVKKVYSISIIYFDLGKGNDYLYKGSAHFNGINTGDELEVSIKERSVIVKKTPEAIFPEYYLIRVNEFDKLAVTPLDEWISYLKTGYIPIQATAPGLSEAREKLRYYDMQPVERQAYDRHMDSIRIQNDVLNSAKEEGLAEGEAKGKAEGFAEGEAKGETKGLAEGKRLTAINMKERGISADIISACTDLTIEEIDKL